jgi:hypothetical protein
MNVKDNKFQKEWHSATKPLISLLHTTFQQVCGCNELAKLLEKVPFLLL